MIARRAVLILAGVLATACASSPAPVDLSGTWPNQAGDFDDVADKWTRQGSLVAPFEEGLDKLLDVSATFHSPEWRTAYVDFRAKREMLPAKRRSDLMAEQRAADEKYYEVMLLVQTHTFRENDLQKGKRSVWRLALVDSKGNEIEASEVESVRTPDQYLRPYYPNLEPRHEKYLARFPKEGLELFASGAERFSLKMASSRGGVELIWKSR